MLVGAHLSKEKSPPAAGVQLPLFVVADISRVQMHHDVEEAIQKLRKSSRMWWLSVQTLHSASTRPPGP